MLNKLLEKKSAKPMDENYKAAKMSTLKALRDEMSGMMKDDLAGAKGMKKVEVAASSPEGLKAGLDQAEEIVEGSDDKDASSEIMPDGMGLENEAEMVLKKLADSPEKCDELIRMLEQKKMEMAGSEE